MNSTQTLIVARLHKMWKEAVAETNRIFADPEFDPEDADRAMIRQAVLIEVADEVQRMELFRG